MSIIVPEGPFSPRGAGVFTQYNRFSVLIALLCFMGCTSLVGVHDVHAGCRWVWQGIDSHWVCDEEGVSRSPGVSICEFSSIRDDAGIPKTVTVFCRSNGTIWQEIIAAPREISVRRFSSDGTLEGQRDFSTDSVVSRALHKETHTPDIRRVNRTEQTRRISSSHSPKPTPKPRKPPKPKPQWLKKNFETSVMGSRIRGTVERKGSDLRGVVYVYPLFGGKDTYHFNGKINGNRVVASHSNGHVFRGTLTPERKVKGVLTTSRGVRIPLDVPVSLP